MIESDLALFALCYASGEVYLSKFRAGIVLLSVMLKLRPIGGPIGVPIHWMICLLGSAIYALSLKWGMGFLLLAPVAQTTVNATLGSRLGR